MGIFEGEPAKETLPSAEITFNRRTFNRRRQIVFTSNRSAQMVPAFEISVCPPRIRWCISDD
jgi:hypothetical protein